MTNIVCTIISVLATNWVTVSRTTPVLSAPQQMQAVMRYDTLNQVGTRVTNYVAVAVWKGQTNLFVLETVPDRVAPQLQRSIYDNPISRLVDGLNAEKSPLSTLAAP